MAPIEAPRGADNSNAGPRRIPVELLVANRANPRRDFDDEQLSELTASIKEKGVIEPLLVGRADQRSLEIIAGQRRWRAAQRAGLHDVPVVVREVDDKEALELAIIENVQRVDLNPLEEAQGYEQLIEQFAYTQEDLAQVIGKSRSHVANTLRLLKLPEAVKAFINDGRISAGHARMLIGQPDPEKIAREIVERGLNVRQVEALAQEQRERSSGKSAKARKRHLKDPDTAAVEKRLSDALGLTVSIDHRGRGGVLTVRYRELDQLDEVIRRLETS